MGTQEESGAFLPETASRVTQNHPPGLSQGRRCIPMWWQLQSALRGEKGAIEKLRKETYLDELVGVVTS